MKSPLALIVGTLAALQAAHLLADEPAPAAMNAAHLKFLNTYCERCHGAETAEASFRVDDLPLAVADLATAARWQKVLNALNSGEMPPEDDPVMDKAAKTNFLDDLAHVMVDARNKLGDQNGVITMRRLNRREYRNSLRELLGVEINVNELPADTSSSGFDTVGTNLFMSGTQFEQYLALGREALEEAFEWEANAAVEHKFRVEGEQITPKVAKYIEYQVDAQDRATRWTKLVDEAVALPENADIVEEIRAGPLGNHRHIFYRSWKKFPGVPAPETFGFQTVENNADKAVTALRPYHLPYHRYYLEQPAVETGAYLAIPNEHPSVLDNATINLLVPFSWPSGEYVVRFRAAITEHATPDRRFIEFGINPRVQQAISAHEITGTMDNPQVVEIPLTMTRGNRERANRSLFLREKGTRDHYLQTRQKANEGRKENNDIGRTFALWVDWMEIERIPTAEIPKPPGIAALSQLPLDDKTQAPSPEALRESLLQFAREAFRGNEPTAKYIDQLVDIYNVRREFGAKHSDALKETLAIVLSSPMFLYLAEPNLEETIRPLTDQELATRLAYFLWSAPPDATLRELAVSGELNKPEVLAAQTTRLLDDPRADAFVNAFTYQWLGLDRLDFFQVNLENHPRFDNATRLSARDEVYETVAHILDNNGSLNDLLKSDYVVINAILATYYGIDNVHGDEFRKVMLPPNSPRGGLLGMAAIHLMGSNGDTTSPVERGVWVLRKLLNDPPPPAPANVPQLARLAGKALTTRERVLAHQEEPQCASCHRKIDPIGFGMENFDAVGAWRTEDSYQGVDADGKPDPKTKKAWTIDPAATLHNGPSFEDFFGLRDIIATRNRAFARRFTESLIEYSLGRPCGFNDEPLIEDILETTEQQNFAMREFILALVQSKAFHSK